MPTRKPLPPIHIGDWVVKKETTCFGVGQIKSTYRHTTPGKVVAIRKEGTQTYCTVQWGGYPPETLHRKVLEIKSPDSVSCQG